jgi:hypothetical protein
MNQISRSLIEALREAFQNWWNLLLASCVAIAAFFFAVWLPNFALIRTVLGGNHIPLDAKLGILASLLGGIATNFTILSAGYTILGSLLLGIYAAMIIHYLRMQKSVAGSTLAIGIGGAASGVIGVGCAACGSFLLTGILSAIGASGALALLPFGGNEFGILAIILLGTSIILVARKISEPLICGIEQNHG